MPIYEYKCLHCGTHLEKLQKVSDEPLKTCEKCGGELEKLISLSGFQFKGEGWYITDYTNRKGAGKTEKSESGESTASTESASNQKKDNSAKETSSKKD